MKTKIMLLLAGLALALPASAQELSTQVMGMAPLINQTGQTIQYAFSTQAGQTFEPYKMRSKSQLGPKQCPKNCLQIETINGVSQLYLNDGHPGGCEQGCSYFGVFTSFSEVLVRKTDPLTGEITTWWHAEGGLTGSLTAGAKQSTPLYDARFSFDTAPTGWADSLFPHPSAGLFTVVLGLN